MYLDNYSVNRPAGSLRKLIFLHVILIGFVLSGCDHTSYPTWSGTWNNKVKIKGSGNITAIAHNLPAFRSIVHNTVGDVNITYGTEQSLQVICDDNIQKYVQLEVDNGSLYISIESDSALSDFYLAIDVVIKDIISLSANSAGSIYGQNTFPGGRIFLNTNSAGTINVNLQVKDLYTTINSAGSIFVKGAAKSHIASVNSAGNLHAFKLSTDTTYIVVTSTGNAEVNVSKYLEASISSAGSVYYIGHPDIVQFIGSTGRLIDSN